MRLPRSAPALRAGAVLLVVLLAGACAESAPKPPKPARPTPIGQLDTAHMVIPRIAFCDLVPDAAVEDALVGELSGSQEWGSGDPARPVTGSAGDVIEEFGCAWTTKAGTTARAWVFGRPVTAAFARRVAAQASTQRGCRTLDEPSFGDPARLQVCRLPGGVLRVRNAGLFGDTWLSCEVSARGSGADEVRARADTWCVEVANALDTAG
jgi:hypothetical protein